MCESARGSTVACVSCTAVQCSQLCNHQTFPATVIALYPEEPEIQSLACKSAWLVGLLQGASKPVPLMSFGGMPAMEHGLM